LIKILSSGWPVSGRDPHASPIEDGKRHYQFRLGATPAADIGSINGVPGELLAKAEPRERNAHTRAADTKRLLDRSSVRAAGVKL
jgi:hypothetical protein